MQQLHHCMSMTALEQVLLRLQAVKALNIHEYVCRKTSNPLCQVFCPVYSIVELGWAV